MIVMPEALMTRKQEIERLIVLHEQALELLMVNPTLFAKEIDRKEQDLAALRMQLAEAA